MNITTLDLQTKDLQKQYDFYSNVLELPANLSESGLEVRVGKTELIFTQAGPSFDGAYHFAFNIPENQIRAAKMWLAGRTDLLHDENGLDEFDSESWNSHSMYFKDAAGNILEFIAHHDLKNAVKGDFDSTQILQVSEIGLPSQDVPGFARVLCERLDLAVFRQEPDETFTPVGDGNGLFILPVEGRVWYPNTGVLARLLPVKVKGDVNGRKWEVRGVPYEIIC